MNGGSSTRGRRLPIVSTFLAIASLSTSLLWAQPGGGTGKKPAKPTPQSRQVQDADQPKAPGLQPAKYYALVIGNNNYQYPGIPKLQTAVKDATDIAKLLQTKYGFNSKLLTNATRDEILTALAGYRKSLTQNSNLLIYYAGHGYLDQDADEAYWFPVDAERDNPSNWISTDDVTRSVRTIPSLHVLVVSDSCYSGAILRDIGSDRPPPGSRLSPEVRAAYIAKKEGSKSRNWMASGSIEPVSDGGPGGHSIFASAILEGLSNMGDNEFAASDLFYSFVQRRVGGNSEQLPQYGSIRNSGDGLGDFIFAKGGAFDRTILLASAVAPPVIDISEPPPDVIVNKGANIRKDVPASDDDQNMISAVLKQYEDGRKRKDAAALWKVWPTAPVETKQRIESYFKTAQSIQTALQMGAPEISADRMSATVSGRIREAYKPKNGDPPPARDDDITFLLKKNNGGWAIVDVK